MKTLLIADHEAGAVSDATARALTMAQALGKPVEILVAGDDTAAAAAQAATLAGASTVIRVEAPELAGRLAEAVAATVVSIAADYGAIVLPASTAGKDVAPRIAARLDVMQISGVTGVIDATTFERPIYAGDALERVSSTDAKLVITVRTASFAPAEQGSAVAEIRTVAAPPLPLRTRVLESSSVAQDRPDLGAARVVISGGRGLGSGDQFRTLLEPLADKLQAALGASRAAVDAGYVPNDWQVGQTGKIVAPDLYIAIGISGAVQHLAGMKDSRVIVAINRDADAPIFKVADYGLVGDLFEIVPALTAALDT